MFTQWLYDKPSCFDLTNNPDVTSVDPYPIQKNTTETLTLTGNWSCNGTQLGRINFQKRYYDPSYEWTWKETNITCTAKDTYTDLQGTLYKCTKPTSNEQDDWSLNIQFGEDNRFTDNIMLRVQGYYDDNTTLAFDVQVDVTLQALFRQQS